MTGFGESHLQAGRPGRNGRGPRDQQPVLQAFGAIDRRLCVCRAAGRGGRAQVGPSRHGPGERVDRTATALEEHNINVDVLLRYRRQFESLRQDGEAAQAVPLEALLSLPGVVDDAAAQRIDAEAEWPLIERALRSAMETLNGMRCDEGRAMAADLAANCCVIGGCLERIERRAPAVVLDYRRRLQERVGRAGRARSRASRRKTWSKRSACSPIVATSPKNLSACGAISTSSGPRWNCRKAPDESSTSSPRRCSAKQTPSARRPTTWRLPAR